MVTLQINKNGLYGRLLIDENSGLFSINTHLSSVAFDFLYAPVCPYIMY